MTEMDKYADCMTFIRYRLEVINRFLNKNITTGYEIPDIETVCLQYRKIFELIAMSSLCANKDESAKAQKQFDNRYHAADILKSIEKVNPQFYPIPIVRKFAPNGVDGTIEHVEKGFLTKEEFSETYGKFGDILHAENPYRRKKVDLKDSQRLFTELYQKIRILLQLHTIQLIDQDTQWWVEMNFDLPHPVRVRKFMRV